MRRWRVVAVACTGAALVAYGWRAHELWSPQNKWMVIPPILAAIAAFYGARLRSEGDRIAWMAIAASCAMTAASFALQLWPNTIGLHNVAQIAGVLRAPDRTLIALGLLAMIADRSPIHDRFFAIEASIVALATALLLWVVVIDPALRTSPLDSTGRLLSLSLPVSDLVLVALAARLALGYRARSRSFVLVQLALLARLSSNVLAYWSEVGGRHVSPLLLDALSTLSFALFVGAALDRVEPAAVAPDAVRLSRVRLVSVVVSALAPQMVLVTLLVRRHAEHSTVLFAAGIAVVVSFLALVRLWGLAVSVRNLAEKRGTERLASLVERSADVVVLVDDDGIISYASPALTSVLGFETYDWVGRSVETLDVRASNEVRAGLWMDVRQLRPDTALALEVSALHANGDRRIMELSAVNLTTNAAVAGIVLTMHDVTATRSLEAQLSERTERDPLTGLPNRVSFLAEIESQLLGGARPTVLYFDLDDFKVINEGLGHAAGDVLLRSVADRLRERFEQWAGLVARIGSDEFGVVLADVPIDTAEDLARQAIAGLKKSTKVNDFQSVSTSACIGLATASEANTATDLMRNAALALERAKQLGKGQVEGFDADLGKQTERRNEYKRDLLDALGRDQFHLVYQPIVRLADGKPIGAEALLRWDHHVYGPVLPSEFVPLAEQIGVMIPIGNWVVEQACSCAAGWADSSLFLTVNVSGMELRDTGFVDTARRALQVNGLPPGRLVIDVTEASLLDDADDASERIQQLRAAGIRTALDDFGTGYSSLSSVRRLPFDMIKIDAEIVQTIDDPRSNAVAATIINMARHLGLHTVAEGVETSAQAAAVRSLGCEFAQGHLFYKPLSPVAMTALVELPASTADATAATTGAAQPSTLPPPSGDSALTGQALPPPEPGAERARPVETLNVRPEMSHLLRPLLS